MKQKENLKELNSQQRLLKKQKEVIHLKILKEKIGILKELKIMNMTDIESKKKEENDQDQMRKDMLKDIDGEIGQNKKIEIIKLKEKRNQMISIIIEENMTIKESIITNILVNIESALKTDIINDFALINCILCI